MTLSGSHAATWVVQRKPPQVRRWIGVLIDNRLTEGYASFPNIVFRFFKIACQRCEGFPTTGPHDGCRIEAAAQ